MLLLVSLAGSVLSLMLPAGPFPHLCPDFIPLTVHFGEAVYCAQRREVITNCPISASKLRDSGRTVQGYGRAMMFCVSKIHRRIAIIVFLLLLVSVSRARARVCMCDL